MLLRLGLCVAAEIALVVFLAMQLGAAADPRTPPREATAPVAEPDAGPGAAIASQAAAAPTSASASLPADERTEAIAKWNEADPIGVLLCGTTRWRDGAPVAGASVSLVQGKEYRGGHSAADGSFAAVSLAPGEWQLTARAGGAIDVAQTFVATDAAVQNLDLVFDCSYPVRVFCVTPDGADLHKTVFERMQFYQRLHVVGQRDPLPPALAPTDSSVAFAGDATFDAEMNPKDGFVGVLHFITPPPAFAALLMRHVVLEQLRVEPNQHEVRFVIDPAAVQKLLASVSVRVLDEAGVPLAKARVEVHAGASMGRPVGQDGRITVENLPPGLLSCSITAPDQESVETTVRVEAGARLDLGEIRLGPKQALTGRVVDEAGKPVSANVQWQELKWRTAPRAFPYNRSTRSEADGTFRIGSTGRGRIALTARDETGRVAVGVFDNPPSTPLELRLAAPAEFTVTRSADPTRSYTLTVYSEQRLPVAAWSVESRNQGAVYRLPAGTWSFEVHDEQDHLVKSGPLILGAGAVTVELP